MAVRVKGTIKVSGEYFFVLVNDFGEVEGVSDDFFGERQISSIRGELYKSP